MGNLLHVDRASSAARRSEPVALAARLEPIAAPISSAFRPAARRADPNAPPRATFFDIGANIEGGLPFQDWARDLRAQRMADNQKDNPDANCLPMGYMQLHGHPQPRKIVQTPELIVIMYEGNQGLRQIFMDGRKLPEVNEDLQPWWYGYSVGRWEGDTLVVESAGFRDDGWLDVYGSPLTSEGKLIERWRRTDYGHLEIDVTVDDPRPTPNLSPCA